MRIARLCACALGLALLLVMLPIAKASDEAITHPVTLGLGGGSMLTLARPFDTILIGNPDVVDVQPKDSRTVLLKALSVGSSNIVFLDEQSVTITNVRVIVTDAHT